MNEAATDNPRGDILRKVLTHVIESDFELAAQRFEIWRMCHKSRCRHARACRGDARACCKMFVDWSEALALRDKQASMDEVRRLLQRRCEPSA